MSTNTFLIFFLASLLSSSSMASKYFRITELLLAQAENAEEEESTDNPEEDGGEETDEDISLDEGGEESPPPPPAAATPKPKAAPAPTAPADNTPPPSTPEPPPPAQEEFTPTPKALRKEIKPATTPKGVMSKATQPKANKIKAPKKFVGNMEIAKVCPMRAKPSPAAKELGKTKSQGKIWVEEVNESWFKVYRKAGAAFVNRDCLK